MDSSIVEWDVVSSNIGLCDPESSFKVLPLEGLYLVLLESSSETTCDG